MVCPMAAKNYSDEFRRQAVELHQSIPSVMIKEIADDLGISRGIPRGKDRPDRSLSRQA
jgi:transposase